MLASNLSDIILMNIMFAILEMELECFLFVLKEKYATFTV